MTPAAPMNVPPSQLSALPRLGLLAIDGPDAATFLQGQATCDVRAVTPARGALGALCNLQGRMIVSFYVLATDTGLALVMPHDRVDAVLTHLQKYAVFSKVTLRAAPDLAVIAGSEGGGSAFTATRDGNATALQLRGNRRLHLVPTGTTLPDGSAAWCAASIAAGEVLVDTANAGRFLPQALNYDVIDGVNFRKGCYTGQEVVARMHFKGKMKERLYVATADTVTAPAANAVIVDGDGNAAGEVVAAVVAGGRCQVAAVLRHDAARAGGLRLADGALLQTATRPYAIPDAG